MLVSPPAPLPPLPGADDAATRPSSASLEAFLADIGPRAFRFAEAGLRQREDALDAVQDAMIKLLSYRTRPAQEWTPLFWSILRRRIIDLQRRRNFRLRFWAATSDRDADSIPEWADDSPNPAQQHEQRQTHARLVAALRTLPARQREAFSLRVLEELDVTTTAHAMGCSEGSVKTHLSRAREALQKHLEDLR
ncbi:RNA polymerase sigma factor [Xanthomonas sp. GPE 39]|uniref:RNA polymerase sigma factor n=1 Tax=Xanthomonas sp. GPE 39 TaxID=1583099 RepID=UPI0005F2F2AA|nr:RNA polymerase sigma factor [Xanthomonas sp. GPE 39]